MLNSTRIEGEPMLTAGERMKRQRAASFASLRGKQHRAAATALPIPTRQPPQLRDYIRYKAIV